MFAFSRRSLIGT